MTDAGGPVTHFLVRGDGNVGKSDQPFNGGVSEASGDTAAYSLMARQMVTSVLYLGGDDIDRGMVSYNHTKFNSGKEVACVLTVAAH